MFYVHNDNGVSAGRARGNKKSPQPSSRYYCLYSTRNPSGQKNTFRYRAVNLHIPTWLVKRAHKHNGDQDQWITITMGNRLAPIHSKAYAVRGSGVVRMVRCKVPPSKKLQDQIRKHFMGFHKGSWSYNHRPGHIKPTQAIGNVKTSTFKQCKYWLIVDTYAYGTNTLIDRDYVACVEWEYVDYSPSSKNHQFQQGGGGSGMAPPPLHARPDGKVPSSCQQPCSSFNPPEYCQGDPCKTAINELAEATQLDSKSQEVQEKFTNMLNQYAGQFDIDNKYKLQHLIAQADIESGGFTELTENISRERANAHYGGFYGNTDKGDGYKYRGRGILQLTFKGAYKNFTEFYDSHFNSTLDFVENPGLLASNPKIAVISGLWYFKYRVMSDVDIDGQTTSKEITEQVNPGAKQDNIDNRKEKFDAVKKVITECK